MDDKAVGRGRIVLSPNNGKPPERLSGHGPLQYALYAVLMTRERNRTGGPKGSIGQSSSRADWRNAIFEGLDPPLLLQP